MEIILEQVLIRLVILDGNGVNDLAVGAYLDDDGGANRGAVHIIYMKSTTEGIAICK